MPGSSEISGDREETAAGPPRARRGSTLGEAISREMVQLQKQFGGKGPTQCKTFVEGDLVVVLFGGGYTAAEQTLYEAGRWVDVREMRTAFQDSMELRFSAKIEELTGREVIAFMSASHQNPDLALEAFILRPLPAETAASTTAAPE
jgi:uncharacterized protein YbcI